MFIRTKGFVWKEMYVERDNFFTDNRTTQIHLQFSWNHVYYMTYSCTTNTKSVCLMFKENYIQRIFTLLSFHHLDAMVNLLFYSTVLTQGRCKCSTIASNIYIYIYINRSCWIYIYKIGTNNVIKEWMSIVLWN